MSAYAAKTLQRFSEELSSESGEPGGGAAAALCALLAVSLYEMVTRINDRRLKKISAERLRTSRELRKNLLKLMDRDAAAFRRISKLYKAKKRGPSWQNALKHGASVPLEIGQACASLAGVLASEKKRTSPWLLSDLKEAAILLESAWHSARLNIEINLKDVNDQGFAGAARTRIKAYDGAVKKTKELCLKES